MISYIRVSYVFLLIFLIIKYLLIFLNIKYIKV